ncbi:MAG: Ig-like domain-containing protein [Methanobrevibacter sp.]|nr:Ig-like domain-containing protein [Methanobrevibacter sp.]
MNKKIILLLLLFLVGVCAISHVSAEEMSSDSELIAAQDTEPVSIDDNADELSDTAKDIIANETSVEVANTSTDEPAHVEKTQATLKASKLTVAHKKSTKWSIKLTDFSGKGISGKNILLKIFTGKKYKTATVKTDANGVAKYNTKKLSAGTHKIIASFVDDNYNCKDISSSVKVVKQTKIKIIAKPSNMKDGSALTILVLNKKTKKFMNGVKLILKVYTGKKYKTIKLKTKKFSGVKGVAGYATNQLSVGKHKVKITPQSFKYSGSKTTKIVIKKSAKKYPGWTVKL